MAASIFPRRSGRAVVLALVSLAVSGALRAAEPLADSRDAAAQVDRLLTEEVLSSPPSDVIAPRTGDTTFLRRAFLDLVGVNPTPAEVTAFVLDPDPDKRSKLVERLLADPRFGDNWARYWRDVIFYRRADDRAFLGAVAVEQFLADSLNRNDGWDKVAADFLTASGNVQEQGDTAIFLAQMGETADIASEVSRIFLGVQINCAQCHDHPTDRWTRQQFHEFAAFFPRVALRPVIVDGRQRGFEVASRDFAPRFRPPGAGNRGGTIEHYMPDLADPGSQGTLMTPVFFATGQKLSTGTRDLDRREALARWMTSAENEWFAKAFVNRVWAELVGEGFYEPVDDLGPDRQCTAPRTMDYLAGQFVAHGYDVKWLYAAILATETYQRESRQRRNPDEIAFAANCAQRLRADQLYSNVVAALGLQYLDRAGPGRGPGGFPGARFGPRGQFGGTFGYDPSEPRGEITGSIPQSLLLMNSSLLSSGLTGNSSAAALGRLLATIGDDEDLVVEIYLRCLAREPNEQELKTSLEHVRAVGNRVEAFEDLLWALINSTEFLHRS